MLNIEDSLHSLNQEKLARIKRVALILVFVIAVCSVLFLLPVVQSMGIALLERLKGEHLRWPDLWKGRMRTTACCGIFLTALATTQLLPQKENRKKALYFFCLSCAFIPWFLFPQSNRITFLRFFEGLPLDKAREFNRLDSLLYQALFSSAALFSIAFLLKYFSFSLKTLIPSKQSHTVVFSIVILLSFISFYLGIPSYIERLKTFWFYVIFDYSDFFNSMVRRSPNGSYPPLANLITGMFKVFVHSPEFIMEEGKEGCSILSPLGSFLIFLFFLTHLLPIALLCHRAIEGSNFTKTLFSLAICTSSFVVYAIIRGNIICLAVPCIIYYMLFYDSKDERLKRTALFALALATNIKVYPAIFGCTLLKKRRWKDIGLSILYSSLLFFPLFFTYDEGVSKTFRVFTQCIINAGSDKISAPGLDYSEIEQKAEIVTKTSPQNQELHNSVEKKEKPALIKALSASTLGIFSLSTTVAAFTKMLQAPRKVYSILLAISYLIYFGLSVLLFIKSKRKWTLFLIPATACYLVPGMTYVYVPIFLLMPLIALLNEEKKRPAEYVAMFILLIMFSCNWTTWPYVIGYKDFPSLLFTVGLYLTAFLTEWEGKKKGPAKQGH